MDRQEEPAKQRAWADRAVFWLNFTLIIIVICCIAIISAALASVK